MFRVVEHFFDPAKVRGLEGSNWIESGYVLDANFFGVPKFYRNVDWAIGTDNALLSNNNEDTNRRNHYTVFDAREAMFRALTGLRKDGSYAGMGFTPTSDQERLAYWATTFRSLGD
ncbi:MAG TPA: hypothetical protein DIC36_05835, partial [Gammaproteobacteria bacterium]|nr:hypothetical protein [Gammaproteobacteria bacterium]